MQRGWVLGYQGTETACFPVVTEPVNSGGTGTWFYGSAAANFFPPLRHLRKTGLRLHHVCLDGGAIAVGRLLEQWDEGYAATLPDSQREYANMATLFAYTLCALHVINGGIRWGIFLDAQ